MFGTIIFAATIAAAAFAGLTVRFGMRGQTGHKVEDISRLIAA